MNASTIRVLNVVTCEVEVIAINVYNMFKNTMYIEYIL